VCDSPFHFLTDRTRRVLMPPEKLTPSQWAERHRYLSSFVSAEPGKYRNDRTPYMPGIVDAICEPHVEEIVLLKAARLGFTTALENLIGWAVDQEPAPALLVMPSQDEARKLVEEQIKPLIDLTPALQAHLSDGGSWDITKEAIRFDSMPLYLGWAGSPQSLARRACRYIFLDEVDKYPPFSGKDADPISLARARARTYLHRKRIVIGSTPTTRIGAIFRAFEDCEDKRYFHVPCPHCGEFQRLVFGQIRFDAPELKKITDKIARAAYIEQHQAAHYACIHCGEAIREHHKPKMLELAAATAQRGWLSAANETTGYAGQSIDRDGNISGDRPKARRIGFHISAIYSPWVSFSDIAAQFIRATGDTGKMMEFRNQWLGEVFEDVVTSIKVEDLRKQFQNAPPAGVVPQWAGVLIASADTQQHHFYFTLRAWGRERSQLVHHGTATSFDELRRLCLETPVQIEGTDEVLLPTMLVIDSGYRTDEVYEFSRTDARIVPIKGASTKPRQVIQLSVAAKETGITVRIIDTDFFKDRLATLRQQGGWLINKLTTDEYLHHLAAEQKVRDRKSGKFIWQPVSAGAANHYLDCEVYNCAGAEIAQVSLLPGEEAMIAQRQAEIAARQKMQPAPIEMKPAGGWINRPAGKSWL
jgi:phage terminase large subunit GpA-like protein